MLSPTLTHRTRNRGRSEPRLVQPTLFSVDEVKIVGFIAHSNLSCCFFGNAVVAIFSRCKLWRKERKALRFAASPLLPSNFWRAQRTGPCSSGDCRRLLHHEGCIPGWWSVGVSVSQKFGPKDTWRNKVSQFFSSPHAVYEQLWTCYVGQVKFGSTVISKSSMEHAGDRMDQVQQNT